MNFILFILLFFLFIVIYGVLSVKKMVKRTHNDRFAPRQEGKASQTYRKRKFDKAKAEDVKYEEVKEED